MTEDAPAADRASLWMEVIRWPLRGGSLGAVILFAVLAWLSVLCEGGYSESERATRGGLQFFVIVAAALALGHYAWRVVSCTYPVERVVPWFGDEGEETPLGRRIGFFFAALVFSFAPTLAWLAVHRLVGGGDVVHWLVVFATAAWGGAFFPLALAGTVVRGTPFAATPAAVAKMRRAEPYAARIAATTGVVFTGLLVVSFCVAASFARHAPAEGAPIDRPNVETVPTWLALLLFVLRVAGFYAALVSFRVAGLLVREVQEIREATA